MKKALFAVMLLLGNGLAFAENNACIESVFVVDPDKTHLADLRRYQGVDVDHVSHLGYEIYGPRGLESLLNKKGVRYTSIHPKGTEVPVTAYRTPEQIVSKLVALQKAYPTLISLIEIGKSVKGRPLVFARLTAPAKSGKQLADRPEFKYVANMHGNEITGRELMMLLIEDLAKNYGKDSRITRLMDSVQIYIMPSMNPDGAAIKDRCNGNGHNLNRNFPDFISDNNNTTKNRQPETQAMMNFQAKHQFKLSANFHEGSSVVNYPWDTTKKAHPLENLVQTLSLDYSKRVPYLYNSTEFPQGIVNGFKWYEVDGGMQDWSYFWYKDLQVTVELHDDKWPKPEVIPGLYSSNRDALLAYIEDIFRVN